MKHILLWTFLLGANIALLAQGKSKLPDFYLEYTSSTRTIIIKGNALTFQEWIETYDNPVSSVPSGRREVVKTYTLTSQQLSALKTLIKNGGFMKLAKNEYGGSAADRFYPYTISVKMSGKQKKVLYRSNPSGESAPKAFQEIETLLNELIKEAK